MRKKTVKKAVIALFFAIFMPVIYCVIAVVFLISDGYTVIDGGTLDRALPYFISAGSSSVLKAGTAGSLSGGTVTKNGGYTKDVTLKLFNLIPVKTVSVNVIKSPKVVPSGECIGVKLYCDGLITIGVTDFKAKNGNKVSPASDAGIKAGDIIKTVNGKKITSVGHFLNELCSSSGACRLEIQREDELLAAEVFPQQCSDGQKRIGIWVRDSIAGIGTMTFQRKSDNSFAALGHGISDSDTDTLMPLSHGKIYPASVLGITKGKKGMPGEIIGTLVESAELGTCTKNLKTGIYGNTLTEPKNQTVTDIAPSSQIEKGKAAVICTVNGEGPKEYSIEIVNINKFGKGGSKCMIIQVTDPRLIEKTGGIVQGMSGSPIIQNGRLIGAVTHVFVNNPQKGYAIFAETMLNELNK